jgi:hypothetical protein
VKTLKEQGDKQGPRIRKETGKTCCVRNYLVACLNACLAWFTGNGRSSMPKDIVKAGSDKKLQRDAEREALGDAYVS